MWGLLSYRENELVPLYSCVIFCVCVGLYNGYFLIYCVESLHVTLGKGETSIRDANEKASVLNISSAGLRKELDAYIAQAGGIENTSCDTFLKRLTLTTSDGHGPRCTAIEVPEEGSFVRYSEAVEADREQYVPLSEFTKRVAKKVSVVYEPQRHPHWVRLTVRAPLTTSCSTVRSRRASRRRWRGVDGHGNACACAHPSDGNGDRATAEEGRGSGPLVR